MDGFEYCAEYGSDLVPANDVSFLIDDDDPFFQSLFDHFPLPTSAPTPELTPELPVHSIQALEASAFGQVHEFSDATSTH